MFQTLVLEQKHLQFEEFLNHPKILSLQELNALFVRLQLYKQQSYRNEASIMLISTLLRH